MFHLIVNIGRSDLRMFARNILHALEYLQSPRSENKWDKMFFLRKRLIVFDLFHGLWSVGTRFRH